MGVGTPLPRYRGMHSDEERLYLLLDRYLAGEASAGDAQAVRDWLAEHPDHPLFLDDLRLIRRVAAERTPESSVDAAWAKAQRPLEVPRQPRRSRRPLFVALAAAAVLIALIGTRGVLRRTPQWREYATTAAQRAESCISTAKRISRLHATHSVRSGSTPPRASPRIWGPRL